MMRHIFSLQRDVRVVPCRTLQGHTGGVWPLEDRDAAYDLTVTVMPDRQSERRQLGTLRPRERRLLFCDWRTGIRQGDHLYFEGDERIWRCMQRRDYPEHQEIEAEVEG